MAKRYNPNRKTEVESEIENKNNDIVEPAVEEKTEPEVVPTQVTVTAEMLNVRKKPDMNSDVVTVIKKGTILSGIYVGNWFELSDGTGYVMNNFVR